MLRSGVGEVVRLGSLGITALATRSTGKTGQAPFNCLGVKLSSGQVWPSYDWIAKPTPLLAERRKETKN